jgi:SAM-dependent methyltransferase
VLCGTSTRTRAGSVPDMDLAGLRALLTPTGQAVLADAAAADLSEKKLLATAALLRRRHPAELVASALTQVRLRTRAIDKFGPDAARMYFTSDGLEQATRASVAAHRARRYASGQPTLDLCSGIGGDLIALARTGCAPSGLDHDPLTVAVARANLDALGLSETATVRCGDATRADPRGYAALFADPGRRTAHGRVFDPKAYRPPLDTLLDLAARAPGACLKVAPGIPHEVIPRGAETEWISAGGEVKEAAIWLGALGGDAERRATLLPAGYPTGHPTGSDRTDAATIVADPGLGDPPVGPWRRYLYEPDGAVIRAHLVAEVTADVAGNLVDAHIAYITADTLKSTPFATAYEIDDVMPFSVKRLRSVLRERRVGTLTIKKRGSAVDIERLRRDLRLRGPEQATVVLTRVGTSPVALICRPA